MSTSERKREANRRNAQNSKGPNRTHLTRFNAVKRGSYAKEFVPHGADDTAFRLLEKNLRADLQPQGELQEICFRRLLRIEWAIRLCERSELAYLNNIAGERRSKSLDGDQSLDEKLLSLKPDVEAAHERMLARQTNPSSVSKPTPGGKTKLPKVSLEQPDLDRAVLEGLAQPGFGGELSQLRQEQRQLTRAFDRALKAFQAAQCAQIMDIRPRMVEGDNVNGNPFKQARRRAIEITHQHDGGDELPEGPLKNGSEDEGPE